MNRYTIRKIFIWPAFKFGALIGAVLMIAPGIVWGLLTRSSVQLLYALFGVPSLFVRGNPEMAAFTQLLVSLNQMGPLLTVWTALLTIIIGGLLYGIGAAIAALLYNLIASLSGGLAVAAEMSAIPTPVPVAQPAPGPQPQAAAALAVASAVPPPQAVPAQPQPQFQAAPVIPQVAPGIQPQPQVQPGPWLAMGQNPVQRWPLRPDRTRLGSAADNDIVLPAAAQHHAEIRLENGVFVLYDQAAGQTWVNDRLVAGRNMLKDGFRIRLGNYEMIFHAS